jgi:hypothetical protein
MGEKCPRPYQFQANKQTRFWDFLPRKGARYAKENGQPKHFFPRRTRIYTDKNSIPISKFRSLPIRVNPRNPRLTPFSLLRFLRLIAAKTTGTTLPPPEVVLR